MARTCLRREVEQMITVAVVQSVDPAEKRKVGGSTPPLPTLSDQHQPRSRRLSRLLGLFASLTAGDRRIPRLAVRWGTRGARAPPSRSAAGASCWAAPPGA